MNTRMAVRKKAMPRPALFYQDSRPDIKGLSRKKLVTQRHGGTIVGLYGYSMQDFSFVNREYTLYVLGDRIFWKSINKISFTFKDGKFYGNANPLHAYDIIVDVFHLDWIKDNSWVRRMIMTKKDLWRDIFLGKITNPEQLAKVFSKRYFKGVYSYKNLKGHFSRVWGDTISLWSVYYYTTNPNLALEVLNARDDEHEFSNLFRDVLYYASILNQKINPQWSDRRFAEEHQKQIEATMLEDAVEYPDTMIAKPFKAEGLHLILNERECFIEGMYMHNCVHTCYWNQVARGAYLLATGTILGVHVDVGITYGHYDCLYVQQVHGIRNSSVSTSIEAFCHCWVDDHHAELLAVLRDIKSNSLPDGDDEPDRIHGRRRRVANVEYNEAPAEEIEDIPW